MKAGELGALHQSLRDGLAEAREQGRVQSVLCHPSVLRHVLVALRNEGLQVKPSTYVPPGFISYLYA